MIHNPCQCCGLPKMYILDPYCDRCLKMIGTEDPTDNIINKAKVMIDRYLLRCKSHGEQFVPSKYDPCPLCEKLQKHLTPNHDDTVLPVAEPTKLTRDQAIRAKALECATIGLPQGYSDEFFVLRAIKFEDYIRDGRKGDE